MAENSAEYEELRATRFRGFYRLAVHALPHLRQQRSEKWSE